MNKDKLFDYIEKQMGQISDPNVLAENEFILEEFMERFNLPETSSRNMLNNMIKRGLIMKDKRTYKGHLRVIYKAVME